MPTLSRANRQLLCWSILFVVLAPQLRAADVARNAVNIATTSESNSSNAPTLSNINPAAVPVGSASFTLTLSGSNFLATSKVFWNGSAREAQYVSAYQLQATISAQDVLLLGNNAVTVSNPGAGQSLPATLSVYLALPTNDLIYDATRGLLWASVPSSAGPGLGNSIVSIDPYTGVVGGPLWVGSEPNVLSISTDGSTLWVALAGSPAVRKVDLNAMVLTPVQMYFPGGWGSNVYASGVAASPGSTSAVAVSAGNVTIYDDATPRPNDGSGGTYLAYGATPSTLYGYSGELFIYSVDSTGIASTQTSSSGGGSNDLRYDDGRLYLTSGQVLDGTTGSLLGTFAYSGPVAPDSTVGRAFVLNSGGSYGSYNQVTAFDLDTFVPSGSFGVGGLDNSPSSLVRWGLNGLAFRTDMGVYVMRSSVVNDLSKMPADVSVSASSPASSTTGANTTFTFKIKNAGPNAVSDASLVATFSGNTIVVSASASQGTCALAQVVRCDLGPMNDGGSASVSVVVIPVAAGQMTGTVLVSSSLPDPKPSNNKASSKTSVTGSAYNVTPVLSAITPQSALQKSAAFTLTVNGSNFASSSTVSWNGTPLPTTYGGSSQLSATVPSNLLGTIGSAQITVSTPAPGGGVSGALPFSIFAAVALDANDIVFDPFTRKLYASIPSTATQVTGNSIVPIDPLTGKIGKPVFIGSEPTRLGISDDGTYLYVVLSGANAVRRMNLTNLTPGTQFTTVNPVFASAFAASDVKVMPGNPNAVSTCGYADGIQVWDVTDSGATSLPLTRALVNDVYEGSVLAWGSSSELYSNDEGLDPSQLHRFAVSASSFAETDATYLDAVDGNITYSGGLIYSDGGGAVDPSPAPPNTPQLVGRLVGGGSSAVDTSINGAFFLGGNNYGQTSQVITAADPTHFITTGSVELDNLPGDSFDLVRWGGNGLAFRMATDFWGNGSPLVVLLSGSFVLPPSPVPNPVPAPVSLSPSSAVSPSNTWVTINGSNFVPGSVALWNGSQRTTVFVNSGQLQVAIAAADLVKAGTAKIKVVNPTPGGGTSKALSFTIQ